MLMLTPTLYAVTTHVLGWGRDPDVSGVPELVVFFLIVSFVPALSLSFGVMAPLALVIDRITAGRTSRPVNLVAGVVIGLAGLAAFLLGGALLAWQPGESFWQVAARPFEVRLGAAAVGVPFFALVGMTIAAGMRHRTRTAL